MELVVKLGEGMKKGEGGEGWGIEDMPYLKTVKMN